ncbi:MAG: hypothetical protein BMS9Abin12_2405 [Acidimicrobiia bacterium]|nr:MAG: hypothetical protein BMS9Abin12_2405 [Acidimicrobiia bacterium]
MANRFEELVTSPYDDEPGGKRPILRWLLWAGSTIIAVVVAVAVLGGDDAEGDPSPVVGSGTTSSVAVATEGDGVAAEPSKEPKDEPPPVLAFDTAAFGTEQVLGETEEGTLAEHRDRMASPWMVIDEVVLIGSIPDTRFELATATAISMNPYRDSFGGPTTCFVLIDGQETSADCFVTDETASTRPVFTGLVGTGVVGWSSLPDAASIGVLTVNNRAIAWQRPSLGIVAFQHDIFPGESVELVVLDDEGTEIDRGTRHEPSEPTEIYVEPITGYGDYTDIAFDDIDFAEADKQIVACMIDNDIPAVVGTRFGPYHSIDLEAITEDDIPEAQEILARCRIGLNLPVRPDPDEAWHREQYDTYVELHACFADLGYEIDPAPAYEEWAAAPRETRWDPALMMGILFPNRQQVALAKCDY